jgi:hypothetical protein
MERYFIGITIQTHERVLPEILEEIRDVLRLTLEAMEIPGLEVEKIGSARINPLPKKSV